jgi:hypothetical protein
MFLTKLKTTMTALLVAVTAITAGRAVHADEQQPAKNDQPAPKGEKPPQSPQKADDSAKLLKSRLDAAKATYKGTWESLGMVRRLGNAIIPIVHPEELYTWSVRWLNAQRDMSDKRDEHITALEEHIKRMKDVQKRVDAMTPNLIPAWLNSAAAWYLADAEIWLAKEKAIQKAAEVVPVALLKARLDAAQEAYKGAWASLGSVQEAGAKVLFSWGFPDEVHSWSVRWLNAQRDMSDKRDERIAILEEHIKRMKELQKRVTAMTPDLLPQLLSPAAAWNLTEAELWLAKEKANQKTDTGEPIALLKARLDAAKEAYTGLREVFGNVKRLSSTAWIMQKWIFVEVYPWSVRWLDAQRDMSDKRDDHIAALEEHIKRMKELQRIVTSITPTYLPEWSNSAVAWYLAEAELWLVKEKAK